ncbi:MAG: hypothetical protein GX947_02510, partial [Tissierellia bacterium]|nr:hypothetical protein [Tissierellia bacterium]
LKEYGDVERFYLGDTVRVIDESLGIDTVQRIMEYERYPYEPSKSSVVLSNVTAEYYKKSTLNGTLANIKKSSDKIDNITNGNRVIAQYVDNIREKLQTEVNSIVQKALLHNTPDMYVDNVNNPTKAMLIGAGVFAIANSKKINGDWNWRTIATGDRVIADEVDANWVYAGGINADQITAGKITADRIDATNLQAASVSSNWVYTGGLSATQITTGKLTDSQINSASTWNGKINANDAVTIIGNTVNAPFINALGIQAASVSSDWVYAGNINANQINAGTISANRISGGTLSGVTLNVNTNATIGKEIRLGSLTDPGDKYIRFGNNMYFYTSSDGADIMLMNYENDIWLVAENDINLVGNAYLNNKKILTTEDIENTGASIVVSDTAPTDHTKIWIDISSL